MCIYCQLVFFEEFLFVCLCLYILVSKYQITPLKNLILNTFPNKPLFLHVSSTSLLKTLWEIEKLVITSNFSFFHNVFYPLENSLPFSSKLELSSANIFHLEESKICSWERVKIRGKSELHFQEVV